MADPGTLGAVHWWRADSNVTLTSGRVSTWGDRIGSADWVQTNSSYRPIVQSAYVNGHDALDFTGSASEYLEQPDPLGMTAAAEHKCITLWFVLKLKADPPATGNTALHNISTAQLSSYPWTDGTIYDGTMMESFRATPGNPTQSLAAWHTWHVMRGFGNNSVTAWIGGRNRWAVSGFVLGTPEENNTNHWTYGSPAQWELGHSDVAAPAGTHLHGYIAEMAIFGLLGPPLLTELQEYTQARYALWTPSTSTVRVTQVGVEAILLLAAMPIGPGVMQVGEVAAAGTGTHTPWAADGSGQSALDGITTANIDGWMGQLLFPDATLESTDWTLRNAATHHAAQADAEDDTASISPDPPDVAKPVKVSLADGDLPDDGDIALTGRIYSYVALTINTEPSGAVQDAPFVTQAEVNAYWPNITITATLASGPGALAGQFVAVSGSDGVARYTTQRIDGATGNHTIIYSSPNFASIISATINVV